MAQCLNTLLTALHLFRDMIIIGKESTIVFSAIERKLKEKAILRQQAYYLKIKQRVMAYSEIWRLCEFSIVK